MNILQELESHASITFEVLSSVYEYVPTEVKH